MLRDKLNVLANFFFFFLKNGPLNFNCLSSWQYKLPCTFRFLCFSSMVQIARVLIDSLSNTFNQSQIWKHGQILDFNGFIRWCAHAKSRPSQVCSSPPATNLIKEDDHVLIQRLDRIHYQILSSQFQYPTSSSKNWLLEPPNIALPIF